MSISVRGVKQPNQARSQRTFERILNAAEALLEDRAWSDLSVNEIIEASGCGAGSFYARFEDKQAVLRMLSVRLAGDISDTVDIASQDADALSLDELVELIVDGMFASYANRRALIRTLTLLPRLHPDHSLRAEGLETADQFQRLANLLTGHGVDSSRAQIALFTLANSVRESVLFPQITSDLISVNDEEFRDHLILMVLSYVRA